jgi:uncharacterized SAM-binding protein YcdF (DUF218 family)
LKYIPDSRLGDSASIAALPNELLSGNVKQQVSTREEVSECKSPTKPGCNRRRSAKRLSQVLLISALLALLVLPVLWLAAYGESFFSLTHRVSPEVLVVDGWIGGSGLQAAAAEFVRGGYKYVVATGDQNGDPPLSLSYAEIAGQELIRLGIPKERIIVAATAKIERGRTFGSAVAAWRALQNRGIRPQHVNLLTLGSHARRSHLVYIKVFAPATKVGVIAWVPADYESTPWWRSTRRTKCFLKEIVGYPFELLLNSGRRSNFPG